MDQIEKSDTAVRLSVIMPVHNGRAYLKLSIPAVLAAMGERDELIVVDDRSADESAQIAEQLGARVIRLPENLGPSGARNAGTRPARGNILVFIDADVVVQKDTLSRMTAALNNDPGLAAVFGSYDNDPADRHLVSSFKNLMHHYVHQLGAGEAGTFWTGCGAIRRHVFEAVGDFRRVCLTCVEDIDYGYRLKDAGHRVLLDADIQCKHLKRWRLWGLIKTDVMERGIPWTIMMMRRGKMEGGLNLGWRHRISALLAAALAACIMIILITIVMSPFTSVPRLMTLAVMAFLSALILLFLFLFAQRHFYHFLLQRRGLIFTLGSIGLHLLYCWYSCIALIAGWLIGHSTAK